MEKNRMKLYFEWRTAVEMAVVLYGILIVIITWLKRSFLYNSNIGNSKKEG